MNKRHLISALLIMTLNLLSCTNASNIYNGLELHTGDLVFVSGDTEDAGENAIMRSTGEMSHVGIIEVSDGAIMVIDATSKGVRRQTMSDFEESMRHEDGAMPRFSFRRLKDASDVELFVENAKTRLGCKYDYTFMPGNDSYYCSELVYESYVRDGINLLQARPMNFRNPEGGYDKYWVDLFDGLGMDIPQDTLGTNPTDMLSDPALRAID